MKNYFKSLKIYLSTVIPLLWNKFITFFKNLYIWARKNLVTPGMLILFIIVCLIVGSEVWVCYLLAIIFHGTKFAALMTTIASAGLFFWNIIPCTPFVGTCLFITIGIKTIYLKIKNKTIKNN